MTGWGRGKCKTDVPWGHAAPKHQDKVRPNSATMFYGKSNALSISANIFVLATSDSSFLLLLNSHYSASWGCFFTSDLASNQIWEHFLFLYSMSSLSSYCSQEAAVTTRHALRFGVTQQREGAYIVQITWNWILDLSDRIKFFSYFFPNQVLASDFPHRCPLFTSFSVLNSTNCLTLICRTIQLSAT